MNMEEIAEYYNDLLRLASSKCGNIHDAEDMASETLLAAVVYLKKGGVIAYPKTWLANTLMHKCNDYLRRKYNTPCIVNLEDYTEVLGADGIDDLDSDVCDYARIRMEINYLTRITREVIIRYYFGRNSISDIAKALSVPEGTVKSRLFAGREQVRKGLEKMENTQSRQNNLPGKLWLSFGGSDGRNGEPVSLVGNDLIAQNLLMLAYNAPLSVSELSRAIGIPAAYIEPIAERLAEGELMVRTGNGKYYTDFIIYRPEDALSLFDAQMDFVRTHFDAQWGILEEMLTNLRGADFYAAMGERQKTKLERYAVLKALQDFQFRDEQGLAKISYPCRRDGGHWLANSLAIPAGYDEAALNKANSYCVWGGHRSTKSEINLDGVATVELFEFDTDLFDNPRRFAVDEGYFHHIHTLLWCIYQGIPLQVSSVPNSFLECMPGLETSGLLAVKNGTYSVDIPVLTGEEYQSAMKEIRKATGRLLEEVGEDYLNFLKGKMLDIPSHLKSVPDLFRCQPATQYLVMGTVREAYSRKLHLWHVDYCCPPVVLVYSR